MVNLEKLSTQERCDLCRKYFLIGLACAPFVWIVNCLWFYDYAFRSKNTDVVEQAEIKPMKKYVIMSSVGIAFWIVLLGIWLYMYTIARDARVPWAEYITFIVPTRSMRRALCGRWHRVFRCTVNARRTLSIESPFWKTVNSTKCSAFLDRVSQNLLATKTGADLNTPHSSTTISYWERIVQSKFKFETIRDEIEQLNQLEASEDADQSMRTMIEKDRTALQESLVEAVDHLVEAIVPLENLDMLNKCQMEFSSGAGGIEAMMFTNELMNMYEQFCQRCGWSWTVFEFEGGQQGGVRFALVSIEGDRVYSKLRFEAGVHRVQRIPVTDKSRIHTSTSSISVMPEPEEAQVEIPSHEVEYEAIRASGPGGQNVNKRSSAVRLTHLPTGIAVHCMDERFQHLNLQIAFKRLGAILLQQKVDSQQGQRTSARRLQVGTKARSEKVRTFNFKDDRITDHRLKISTTNVQEFMAAGAKFEYFLDELQQLNQLERLNEIVNFQ